MIGQAAFWGGGFGLPETVALAAVAAIGYVFGRRGRKRPHADKADEVLRATEIARHLTTIATTLRRDLALHHAEINRFKRRVDDADGLAGEQAWEALRAEAERVLQPTLRLVGQVATAYDQIRQQSQALSNFSGGRTDAVTGLANRRALDEMLEMELSGHRASHGELSVVVFSVDASADNPGDGHAERQERMLRVAEYLRPQLRARDLVARYGVDELVVVMPHTRLFGAAVFGRRVRSALLEQLGVLASGGVAQSIPADSAKALLARADSALYSARAAGEGLQYVHTGQVIRRDEADPQDDAPVADRPTVRLATTPVD